MEKINVRFHCQCVLKTIQDEPCCQQVQIISSAVKGDKELLVRCNVAQIAQHGLLLREIPCKELAGDKRTCIEPPEPDEEGKGAGASCEARGLSIEEQAVF